MDLNVVVHFYEGLDGFWALLFLPLSIFLTVFEPFLALSGP